MNAFVAAEHLFSVIDAPRGAVNVSAWPDNNSNYVLKVWVNPGAGVRGIPSSFEGFKVLIESKPKITAGKLK
jgi:hypothetical protein